MPNKKNKSSEDIADQAIARAKAMKEVSEQNVRKQLMESFAPQLKKMISQSILEMEDEELDMDDLNEEEDDIDPEDLEDLENALDEEGEGEDADDDGHVEVPTDEVPVEDDMEDEVPVEDDELEEATDDYDDMEMEEQEDEDFLAELRSILEEDEVEDDEMEPLEEGEDADTDDEEELNEVEGKKNGDSYDQDAPPEGDHTKKYENKDGGSYTDDGEGKKGDHTKKYEAIVKENKKLRRALSEINNSLNETVLDEYKTQKFKSIVEKRKLTETAKLKVMRAIDEGKSEKEVDRITSVFESTLPKSSKKRSIKESKGGRNSSIRKPKGKKKAINENGSRNSVGYDWADRLANLSGIE